MILPKTHTVHFYLIQILLLLVVVVVVVVKIKINILKGLVHPKMKISPCFTHPQGILGVYDFLLSDESNQLYKK